MKETVDLILAAIIVQLIDNKKNTSLLTSSSSGIELNWIKPLKKVL